MNVAAVMDCASFNVFWSADFRPLRTEREKVINDLIEIICASGELSKDGSAAHEIAERIYNRMALK